MTPSGSERRIRPWLYFALAYAWTWLFWLSAALGGRSADPFPASLLIGLGGVGPLVSALLLVYRTLDGQGRQDYWRRLIEWRRIAPRWYAVILLLPLGLTGLAALFDLGLGGAGLQLEAAASLLAQPLSILPFVLFYLVFGPLPEEMGWRGLALPGLQARRTALAASLILGAVWALWHLPLFFVRGSFQSALGVGTPAFWAFMLGIVPLSVVYTWIFNNNRSSTLSAILFHFAVNATGQLFALSQRGELLLFGLWIALAALVTVVWGPERLSRGEEEAALAGGCRGEGWPLRSATGRHGTL